MKIFIIGGAGVIGRKVSQHFSKNHQVTIGSRTVGDVKIDISDPASILAAFQEVGPVDAVINIAGEAKWGPFADLTDEDFDIGLRSKLMGQVNLVRIGKAFVNPSGSFTLTTGILADYPVALTTSAAMVNGGIHSFVKAVALEMPKQIRINVVSSGLVEDSVEKYSSYFPGHNPIPMFKVVNGYVRSVEGLENGQVITIYDRT